MTKAPRSFAMPPSKQIFISLVILAGVGFIYWKPIFEQVSQGLCTSPENLSIDQLRLIYNDLLQAQNENKSPSPRTMLQLSEILRQHKREVSLSPRLHSDTSTGNHETFVCPEKYLGTRSGYMFFFTGWKIENCVEAPSISDVITLLLYPKDGCSNEFFELLSSFALNYSDVSIFWAGTRNSSACDSIGNNNVRKFVIKHNWSDGFVWNMLVKSVNTPTVLIGRDVYSYVNLLAPLERLLRMLSTDKNVFAVGGAVRNRTGHWRVGCYQTEMKNYVLSYEEGYYVSRNECMFCNHIDGPFVARTEHLMKITFDEKIASHLLLEDLFLRVRENSFLVVTCPDVMFMTSGKATAKWEHSRTQWMELTQKWELNRIVLPSGQVFAYSCAESQLSCKGVSSRTTSFLMPICCVEQLANAIWFLDEFAGRHGLRYEFEAGSVLGIVKMADYIPWDLDGDGTFLATNVSVFRSFASEFFLKGFKLSAFNSKGTYFKILTPDLYIEMWGEKNLSSDVFMPEVFRSVPTKVRWHGRWVSGPLNPGAYARNRYGHDILKHAHSWGQLGMRDSWQQYRSGQFFKCKKRNHHACLDHFSSDGNLQFAIPKGNC